MERRIKYICYYDRQEAEIKRNCCQAAVHKLDYIFEALNANGIGIDIVSASECVEPRWIFVGNRYSKSGNNTLRLFASFGKRDNPVFRVLNRWFVSMQFFFYLLFKMRKGEEFIVYHSLGYARLISLAKKIKKFHIIGEIEEIYQDVHPYSKAVCRAEYRFIENCDKYIFPTQLLDEKLNRNAKPSLVVHGTYKAEPVRNERFDDGKIHVVYSGTFDPDKGGAAAAIAAAAHIDNPDYHLHISGFGNKKDTELVERMIDEAASESICGITFEGLLDRERYIRLLQKCRIGLSTHNPTAIFNATSFPSKILSYMANGLHVVSPRIEAIERSAVGDYLCYYDRQTPEDIAKAILTVNAEEDYDSRTIIRDLDKKFKSRLGSFL